MSTVGRYSEKKETKRIRKFVFRVNYESLTNYKFGGPLFQLRQKS